MDYIYDVFISYSTDDKKIAEGVCGFLEMNGIRCFVAYRELIQVYLGLQLYLMR